MERSSRSAISSLKTATTISPESAFPYFETGNPFLTFKDTANRANPNKHAGIIRSTNLCTEIFQNTAPNHYKTLVIYEDGSRQSFEEEELVTVDNGMTKPAKKITVCDRSIEQPRARKRKISELRRLRLVQRDLPDRQGQRKCL